VSRLWCLDGDHSREVLYWELRFGCSSCVMRVVTLVFTAATALNSANGGTAVYESSRGAFSSQLEDCRSRSRRQTELQLIELFEHGPNLRNPAFHFCAQ